MPRPTRWFAAFTVRADDADHETDHQHQQRTCRVAELVRVEAPGSVGFVYAVGGVANAMTVLEPSGSTC